MEAVKLSVKKPRKLLRSRCKR